MRSRPWPRRWQAMLAEARAILRSQPDPPGRVVVLEDDEGCRHGGIGVPAADSSGPGVLAEQTAAARLRLAGGRTVTRVLVLTGSGARAAPPSGGALQILHEHGPGAAIAWGSFHAMHGRSRLDLLLPRAFSDYRRSRREGPA